MNTPDLTSLLIGDTLIVLPLEAIRRGVYATRILGFTRSQTKNVPKVWGSLLPNLPNRRQNTLSKQPKVLFDMQPVREEKLFAPSRRKGHGSQSYLFQVRSKIQVWREVQQSGAPKRNLQHLQIRTYCTQAQRKGSAIQGRSLSTVRVRQMLPSVVLSSCRFVGQVCYRQSYLQPLLGENPRGVGQMCAPLHELSCRTPRGVRS